MFKQKCVVINVPIKCAVMCLLMCSECVNKMSNDVFTKYSIKCAMINVSIKYAVIMSL